MNLSKRLFLLLLEIVLTELERSRECPKCDNKDLEELAEILKKEYEHRKLF
jgi:hypothetical protein